MADPESPVLESIADFVAHSYALRMGLVEGDHAAHVCACQERGFDEVGLVAHRDALAAVEARCAVSRAGRQFLDDVLGEASGT